jgi:hypothetical protein
VPSTANKIILNGREKRKKHPERKKIIAINMGCGAAAPGP